MARKMDSGIPNPKTRTTRKVPSSVYGMPANMQAKSTGVNLDEIAQEIARQYQGKVLRHYVSSAGQLVVLFVDGRKHYLNIDK